MRTKTIFRTIFYFRPTTPAAFLSFLIFSLLLAPGKADDLQPLWQLVPGDRDYITTVNTERGIAYNPATGHLLLVSRAAGVNVIILDAKTGAELGLLDTTDIGGGTFALSLIGIASDGAIYAGNLSTSTTSPNLKLYRWENETAPPTVAYDGDPADGASNQRWGDSLDVRGAGVNTQVAIAARASAQVVVFTTTDGVNFAPSLIPGVGAAGGSLSVAFGTGETLWTKINGQPLKQFSFNLAAKTASEVHSFGPPLIPSGVSPIGVSSNYLGAIEVATPDTFRFYDISNLANGPLEIASPAFPTDNANANVTGYVEFGEDMVFALDTNNGLVAWKIIKSTSAEPPTLTSAVTDLSILESGNATFNVGVKGTPPFTFQWQYNGTNIVGATNATLTLTNVPVAASGSYSVVIGNSAGTVDSSAVLTVTPIALSDVLTKLWQLAPGDRPYIAADNSQRGLAYNLASSNLLVVSRTGGANIWILNGETGAEVGKLNTDPAVVSGGTFTLNMIGVSDDGKIYAANLTTGSDTSPFIIYRWDDENTNAEPVRVYTGDPTDGLDGANRRFGDTFAVRGAGASTELLAGSRLGTNFTIFRPTDASAIDFVATSVGSDAPAGSFGLGIGFGPGSTVFGKGDAPALVHASYDLPTATATVVQTFTNIPTSARALASQSNFLATVSVEAPDNLRLYQLNAGADPLLVDQEIFPADNPNINGTGAIAFTGNRLYALDSNNGILAMAFNPNANPPAERPTLSGSAVSASGFSFIVTGTPGATYKIESTTDLKTWSLGQTITIPARGNATVTATATASFQFFRAVAP